ncbi:MAG: hypothetical protein ACYTF1_03710 [Planctomycetota bacterium]
MQDKQPRPIFDIDIACPQCGFNLRRITTYRCPECGTPFDSHELLEAHFSRTSPSFWETLNNVCRHPINFWSRPEIVFGQVPAFRHVLSFLLIGIALIVVLHLGYLVSTNKLILSPSSFLTFTLTYFLGLIVCLFWVLVHILLCRPAFRGTNSKDKTRKAEAVVGYAFSWAVFAFPALAGTAKIINILQSAPVLVTWCIPAGLAFGAATYISCLFWAVTLYHGGIAKSNGSRLSGIWCTITNPFWYLAVSIILAAL